MFVLCRYCSRGRCGEALSYRRVTRLVGVAAGGWIPSRLRSFVEGGAGRGAAEKSLVSVSLGSVDLTRSSLEGVGVELESEVHHLWVSGTHFSKPAE